MLIFQLQKEMEDQKKANRKRPRKPVTEPNRSDTQSQKNLKTDIQDVMITPYDLKVDRYKQKPNFPRADRFITVEPKKPPKLPTLQNSKPQYEQPLYQSSSPRSNARSQTSLATTGVSSSLVLEKVSLSQMKA